MLVCPECGSEYAYGDPTLHEAGYAPGDTCGNRCFLGGRDGVACTGVLREEVDGKEPLVGDSMTF